ncbi:MAG: LamG domain-containing protein [Myxococcota bacterium]
MRAAARRAAVLTTVTVVGGGCPNLGGYFCAEDSDCNRGDQTGVCLVDNACGYPDPSGECDSGFVRSPNADRLPGQCVPVDGIGGSGSTASSGSGTDDMDSVADTGATSTSGTAGTSEGSDDGPASCGQRAPIDVEIERLSPLAAIRGYPLYLRIDDPAVTQAAAAANGVVITDAQGAELPAEREDPALSSEALTFWVALPDHAAGDIVRMYVEWGETSPAADPTGVWSAYAGVWHFDRAPNGVQQQPQPNSAVPGEPALSFGSIEASQGVPARVGAGVQFDGDDDSLQVPNETSFVGQLENLTISMWARYDGENLRQEPYFDGVNGAGLFPRCWIQAPKNGNGVFCQNSIDGTTVALFTGEPHPAGTWIHLALRRDATAAESTVWIDGQLAGTSTEPPGAMASGTNPFEIGSGEWGTFTGTLDEVRVSAEVIDQSWFVADANHHPDPAAAVTLGPIEDAPCND